MGFYFLSLIFVLLLTFPWGAWTNLSDGTRSTGSSLGFYLGSAGPCGPSESSATNASIATPEKKWEHLLIGGPHQSEPWISSLSHLIPHLYPSNGGMTCKLWEGVGGWGLTVLTFNSLLVRIHSRPKSVLVTWQWPLQSAKKRRSRAWKWGRVCCFRFLNELMYPYINIYIYIYI